MELPHVLSLARISSCIALGKDELLRRQIESALSESISIPLIREAILQTYLFAGYAATINAFIVLNDIVGANQEYFSEENSTVENWTERGIELCRRIYGNQFERLIANMKRLHPDLADWMIWEGYGKVLSRPFLTPRVRELLIVAMTAVLQVERQFYSHVRGAIHVGATSQELRAVFEQVIPYMSQDVIPSFQKILDDLSME